MSIVNYLGLHSGDPPFEVRDNFLIPELDFGASGHSRIHNFAFQGGGGESHNSRVPLPPPKKRKNGSQKYRKKPYEVHLEVTRLERHAIFRKSISLDDVDCFEALKSHMPSELTAQLTCQDVPR